MAKNGNGSAKKIGVMLQGQEAQIASLLPTVGIRAPQLIRVALLQFSGSDEAAKKLRKCTPASIYRAILQSAIYGIEADGRRSYLIPYWNKEAQHPGLQTRGAFECNYQLSYLGMRELALRSDRVKHVEAHVVRKADTFELAFGMEPSCRHVPDLVSAPSSIKVTAAKIEQGPENPILGAYAIAWLNDHPHPVVKFLTLREVESLRMRNKKPDNYAWTQSYPEMCCVKAIRALCKHLPARTDDQALQQAQQAAVLDERLELGLPVPEIDEAALPEGQDAAAPLLPDAPKPKPEADAGSKEQRDRARAAIREGRQPNANDLAEPPESAKCAACGDPLEDGDHLDAEGRCPVCSIDAAQVPAAAAPGKLFPGEPDPTNG